MTPTEERDDSLMAQVASGRPELLERLVRRHASPLLTFIVRMVGDRHRGEELFQEVFLAVWRKRGQYQFPRPFKPWLYRIAVNRCRAAFRGRAWTTFDFRPEDGPPHPAAPDPSPADKAVATETAALVAAAVTRLPPQQRVVVVLRVWDGLSYAQIAEVLGRTEATVRSHMHHGLIALRKDLDPLLA